jgi:hypothetical protein
VISYLVDDVHKIYPNGNKAIMVELVRGVARFICVIVHHEEQTRSLSSSGMANEELLKSLKGKYFKAIWNMGMNVASKANYTQPRGLESLAGDEAVTFLGPIKHEIWYDEDYWTGKSWRYSSFIGDVTGMVKGEALADYFKYNGSYGKIENCYGFGANHQDFFDLASGFVQWGLEDGGPADIFNLYKMVSDLLQVQNEEIYEWNPSNYVKGFLDRCFSYAKEAKIKRLERTEAELSPEELAKIEEEADLRVAPIRDLLTLNIGVRGTTMEQPKSLLGSEAR